MHFTLLQNVCIRLFLLKIVGRKNVHETEREKEETLYLLLMGMRSSRIRRILAKYLFWRFGEVWKKSQLLPLTSFFTTRLQKQQQYQHFINDSSFAVLCIIYVVKLPNKGILSIYITRKWKCNIYNLDCLKYIDIKLDYKYVQNLFRSLAVLSKR